MSNPNIRLRFAPSPTGYMHVGNARTALFNWLFARHTGGAFVLRIEDTDRERSQPAMTQVILDGLSWLGLDWDEGPLFQAAGLAQHQADARALLAKGALYRCFCTPAQVEARRVEQGIPEGTFRYDRFCLRLPPEEVERRTAAGEAHTLRVRVPPGITAWDDIVHGRIEFENAAIEDFIVLRSDGTPIYNMAVVSDDVHMQITHVLRGDDHISNTPKQILLYDALGAARPRFGHMPMILGPDGKRLSKRHGATAVGEYQSQGILPEAMINFLALLGWSPGTDQEVFTREELIAQFSFDGVNKKSAIFDAQKLSWLNGQHLARTPAARLVPLVTASLVEQGLASETELATNPEWLQRLIDVLKVRSRTVHDIAQLAGPYFVATLGYDADAVKKHWKDAEATAQLLQRLRVGLGSVAEWTEPALENELRALAETLGVSAGKLIHPLRVALTGQAIGPGIFEAAVLLGRERALQRLDAAVTHLSARA
jgi:glutamyl-tRNA synthetase